MNVPPLDSVRATLDRDDPPGLEAALRPCLGRPSVPVIREVLQTVLHPWYTAGPQVGDETTDSWCWCHSFVEAGRGPDPVGGRLAALLEQVAFARMWRRDMVEFVDGLPAGGLDRPEEIVLAAVERVVARGIHDAWYVNVHPVLAWILDRYGIDRTPDQLERLSLCCELGFRSWCAPDVATRRAFADEAGWILVERELDDRFS